MHTGSLIELRADQIDAEGAGVGQGDGHTVHARGLAPGERGAVRIEHVSPHRREAWGALETRLGPASPDRVPPACPAYGRCGGCAWQHLSYPAQLRFKRARVTRALASCGYDGPVEIVPAPQTESYRNVGKYVVAAGNGGLCALGAYAPRSHEFVPTIGCRLVEPPIDAAARATAQALQSAGLAPFDERQRSGDVRYVVARANRDGDVLLALVTHPRTPRETVKTVATSVCPSAVAGVVWIRNDSSSGSILAGEAEPVAGVARLVDWLGAVPVELAVTAFFQVNRAQAEAMYRFVADAVGASNGQRVADVYCGVGGIALTLAHAGAEVIGIERVRDAVAAARAAASQMNLDKRARFECADASSLSTWASPTLDAAVVNPPRKGLDRETRAALAQSDAAQLVYVSCNPDTLARDVRELAGTYELVAARAFDLMPSTAQVETVAELRRVSPR